MRTCSSRPSHHLPGALRNSCALQQLPLPQLEAAIRQAFPDCLPGIKVTGADSFALNGALVGYGVDYVQLGEATADMVSQLLCDGKTPADLPYQTFDNGIVTINTETCEALGLDLDTVKEAFKPYCTEIVEVTTAENFS